MWIIIVTIYITVCEPNSTYSSSTNPFYRIVAGYSSCIWANKPGCMPPRWCGYLLPNSFVASVLLLHCITCLYLLAWQGDADIFFPTDFRLLEQIDHNCAGFSKEQKNPGAFKPVKKRRTIIVSPRFSPSLLRMPAAYWTKTNWCVGHRANPAWYCSLHGGVWHAAEDEDQRRV